MKNLIYIVVFSLAMNPILSAQEIHSGFEIDFGRTKMELAPKSYFSWRIGFTFSSSRAIYSIDYFNSKQPNRVQLLPRFLIFKGKNRIGNINLMYGRNLLRPGNLGIFLSSGVSFISGTYEIGEETASNPYTYEKEEVRFTTVGLPLKLHLRYRVIDGFGVGFSLFGNINSKNKYWGREAAIYIGGVFSEK